MTTPITFDPMAPALLAALAESRQDDLATIVNTSDNAGALLIDALVMALTGTAALSTRLGHPMTLPDLGEFFRGMALDLAAGNLDGPHFPRPRD